MRGRNKFSETDANKIKNLICEKVRATPNEQKVIRNKIRRLGFYYSDFSNQKGYTVEDFNALVDSGEVVID